MTDHREDLATLTRPRLLVQAARIGAERLLQTGRTGPRRALDRLLARNRSRSANERTARPITRPAVMSIC